MRDRLIELLKDAPRLDVIYGQDEEWKSAADFLLANGVIVPPCKVGDKVYDVCFVFDESTLKSKKVIKRRVIDFVSSPLFIIESKGLILGERDFGKKSIPHKRRSRTGVERGDNK